MHEARVAGEPERHAGGAAPITRAERGRPHVPRGDDDGGATDNYAGTHRLVSRKHSGMLLEVMPRGGYARFMCRECLDGFYWDPGRLSRSVFSRRSCLTTRPLEHRRAKKEE